MLELFVVGTFWFWALVIVEILLLFVFVNYENGIGATVSLLVFGACLQYLGGVDILNYVTSHPLAVCLAVLGYLLAGMTWSVIRWYIFCRDQLRQYNTLKSDFLKEKGLSETKLVPEELRSDWLLRLESYRQISYAPSVRDHKNQIIGWMAFWVISMIWFFINDLVKWIFKEIYHFISGFLQRIADNVFADIYEDLPKGTRKRFTSRDRR